MDLPCPTLVTMPNHASTSLCHPTETRALSLREYARIQEFPDDWEICGTPAEQYAQIGNAVPLRLGEVAGQVLADGLDQARIKDWKIQDKPTKPFQITHIHAHVRTRRWFGKGEALVWSGRGKNAPSRYGQAKTARKTKIMTENVR